VDDLDEPTITDSSEVNEEDVLEWQGWQNGLGGFGGADSQEYRDCLTYLHDKKSPEMYAYGACTYCQHKVQECMDTNVNICNVYALASDVCGVWEVR